MNWQTGPGGPRARAWWVPGWGWCACAPPSFGGLVNRSTVVVCSSTIVTNRSAICGQNHGQDLGQNRLLSGSLRRCRHGWTARPGTACSRVTPSSGSHCRPPRTVATIWQANQRPPIGPGPDGSHNQAHSQRETQSLPGLRSHEGWGLQDIGRWVGGDLSSPERLAEGGGDHWGRWDAMGFHGQHHGRPGRSLHPRQAPRRGFAATPAIDSAASGGARTNATSAIARPAPDAGADDAA